MKQKYNAPEFIIPEDKEFDKNTSSGRFYEAFEEVKKNSATTDLNGLIENLPFGSATKIELLHFVLYHTERHLHQLKNIIKNLN